MQRKISIGERTFALELLSSGKNGDVRFRFEAEGSGAGDGRDASVIEVAPGIWSVLIDGRAYEARVLSDDGPVVVEINGERYPVTVEDPRRRNPARRMQADTGRVSITAPMPGRIVRVLGAEGDSVAAGQGIVVMEAMKMQNELKSPRAGRIASLSAREGETVAAGAVLAVVE